MGFNSGFKGLILLPSLPIDFQISLTFLIYRREFSTHLSPIPSTCVAHHNQIGKITQEFCQLYKRSSTPFPVATSHVQIPSSVRCYQTSSSSGGYSQPYTAETQYLSQTGLCGICGKKRGSKTDFSRNNLFAPCRYLSTNSAGPHTQYIHPL